MTWFAGTTIGWLVCPEEGFAPSLKGGFCGVEPAALTDGGCEPMPQPRVSPNDAAAMSVRSCLARQGLIDSSYIGNTWRVQSGCNGGANRGYPFISMT